MRWATPKRPGRRRKPIQDGRWITVRGRPVLVTESSIYARISLRPTSVTREADGLFVLRFDFDGPAIDRARAAFDDVRKRWLAIVDRLHSHVPNSSTTRREVP